jgi:hypothetical protein
VKAVDKTLCEAWALASGDWTDAIEDELGRLLPVLIDAGYVRTYGHSRTGFLWAFTDAGVERVEALGCDE